MTLANVPHMESPEIHIESIQIEKNDQKFQVMKN